MTALKLNLCFGWIWILLGFVSGMLMGLFFHREDWMGGYGSFRRRLYRLAHISFFGLGTLNLLLWSSAGALHPAGLEIVSVAWLVGGLTMPLCCLFVAHLPKLKAVFAVPVVSLVAGAGLLVRNLIHTL